MAKRRKPPPSPRNLAPSRKHHGDRAARTKIRSDTQQIYSVKSSKAYKYYDGIPWDEWWAEFATATNKDGSYKYTTAWQFAMAMTTDEYKRKVIYACIGAKPTYIDVPASEGPRKRKRLERLSAPRRAVPWLGDWAQKRSHARLFNDPRLESMNRAVEKSLSALEAGQGVASKALTWMGRFEALAREVEQLFGGKVLLDGLPEKDNLIRFSQYMRMMTKLHKAYQLAQDDYLACHGMSRTDSATMNEMFRFANHAILATAAASQVAATVAGEGARQQVTASAVQVASLMLEKAKAFELPLPNGVVEAEAEVVEEGRRPIKGKKD